MVNVAHFDLASWEASAAHLRELDRDGTLARVDRAVAAVEAGTTRAGTTRAESLGAAARARDVRGAVEVLATCFDPPELPRSRALTEESVA